MAVLHIAAAVLALFGLAALADSLSEVARLRRLVQSERAHWQARLSGQESCDPVVQSHRS